MTVHQVSCKIRIQICIVYVGHKYLLNVLRHPSTSATQGSHSQHEPVQQILLKDTRPSVVCTCGGGLFGLPEPARFMGGLRPPGAWASTILGSGFTSSSALTKVCGGVCPCAAQVLSGAQHDAESSRS